MATLIGRMSALFLSGALIAMCAACETTGGSDLTTGKDVVPEGPIKPLIDVAERKAELEAIPSNQRGNWCRLSMAEPSLTRRAVIKGPIEYQDSNVQRAGNALFGMIETYYGGFGFANAAEKLRDALAEGAHIGAFTDVRPYTPPEYPRLNKMNEPFFQVANFLVPLSHAYLIVKEEYPEDATLLADIRQWGNRLFELTASGSDSFTHRYKDSDRRAHIAQGWASWGNVAENRRAINRAYSYYQRALAGTGKGGVDLAWVDVPKTGGTRLSFVNATLQSALVAAHALHKSGVSDVYTLAPGGGTLSEGLAWLWNRIEATRPVNLIAGRHDGSKSIAWIELFIHEFPDHPTSGSMKKWIEGKGAMHVNMGGGPTTCLYRAVANT
ncbi:MAG: hypothetical protein OXI75_16785 [Rhodospirillales bacterium]|nr:hypothetical protein [Rhodospirillales bacterium]